MVIRDHDLAIPEVAVLAEDRGERRDQPLVERTGSGDHFDGGAGFIDCLDGIIVAIFRDIEFPIEIEMRTARHRQNLAGFRVHQHHGTALGDELGEARVQLLLNDGLQANIERKLHIQAGARRHEAR